MYNLLSHPFQNDFVAHFDGDRTGNPQPRQTPGVLYSTVMPTPVNQPSLLAWSDELAAELGIQKPVSGAEVDVLGGNGIAATMQPYAACYGGHQFGHWAGQLGDGRAITLGEWDGANGVQEFQLKGAGITPYSRNADGRAVLRSSLREYLMSEAMHYLGVPTTRALSLVATGDAVTRDMFYNGNPAQEPGAIVMRVAPSFLRFGNFEILFARKDFANLRRLADWTIDRFYPHIKGEDRIVRWLTEVVERTAKLMAEWMRVGFVHGVMNTDNMSVLGLTIDYGPYSFVDDYDPMFTPNTTDLPGRRYAFGRQPSVAKWNLSCLAGALVPLMPDPAPLAEAIQSYDAVFSREYYDMMGRKLGFSAVGEKEADVIADFSKMLAAVQPDMTLFYQKLIDLPADEQTSVAGFFGDTFYCDPSPDSLAVLVKTIASYQACRRANSISEEKRSAIMRAANPRFVLRNYLLHQAIEQLEQGENVLFAKLQQAIRDPYSARFDELIAKRPDWAAEKAGCSMLSCSS